jgi:hypothetical protein
MRCEALQSVLISMAMLGCGGAVDDPKFDSSLSVLPATPDADCNGRLCALASVGQGAACNTATPCQNTTHNYCNSTLGGSGYCTTTGCTSSKDCGGGYYCDLAVSPSICRQPPTGEGTPCKSPADCAKSEANFCELYVSKTCLLAGCSESLNNCDDTHICCDFAWMGLPSLCIDKVLSGGVCFKP